MPRATNSPASRKRRKRMLQKAKGYRGFRSKLYRYAKDAVYKAQQHAYRDRNLRKVGLVADANLPAVQANLPFA